MLNRPEILAPAGSMDALKAAVSAGADACYAGGNMFSARAFAGNFDTTELLEAIDYCHIHNVKLYMAVNTLLKNSEMKDLIPYLDPFYREGVDGIIVQDVGVIRSLSKAYPDLPLHGSTQMSVCSTYGAEFLKNLGMTRFVPARELSLNEIKSIKEAVDIEIETFVHGAMCFCYSGKCLMSSFAGGRSGNRGRCAQPCRKAYNSKQFNHEYALSMKDMCTLASLPQLIEAGIDSFKIEGRMKKPEYVAAAVHAYSEITDECINGHLNEKRIAYHTDRLMDIYNRGGFSSGYYYMKNGKEMLANKRPNHTGTLIGKVEAVEAPFVYIRLERGIQAKDVLEIRTGTEQNIELTSNVTAQAGQKIRLNANNLRQIRKDMHVYRTRNNALIEDIGVRFIQKEKQTDIYGKVTAKIGEPITLELFSGVDDISVKVKGECISQAAKRPVEVTQIIDKLSRTGGTGFNFYLESECDENIFISLGSLNVLRREAVRRLEQALIGRYRRRVSDEMKPLYNSREDIKRKNEMKTDLKRAAGCYVSVKTMEQFQIVNNYEFVRHIIIDYNIIREAEVGKMNSEKKIYVAFPDILRENKKHNMKDLYFLAGMTDGIYVKNIDELGLLKEYGYKGTVLLDSFLYAYNDEAIRFYKDTFDNVIFVGSVELTHHELESLCTGTVERLYGYQPVMITAQCFINNYLDGCGYNRSKRFSFRDEKGNRFFSVNNCRDCYSIIYNGVPTDNVKQLTNNRNTDITNEYLIDFTIESVDQTKKVMDRLEKIQTGETDIESDELDYTRGHYIKGIE